MLNDQLSLKIRIDVLNAIQKSGASHIASAFSIVEILISIYNIVDLNLITNKDINRDIVILSKGHAGIALYATLKNYGLLSENDFNTYYLNGSKLSGHISHKGLKGVEFSTGSLGHGLGVACGFAYDKKLNNIFGKVLCILGDGECNEGSIWESTLFAAHHKLDNLVAIIDNNSLQGTGSTINILNQDISRQFSAFGWEVAIVDGHDIQSLENAFINSKNINKPLCVVADTIKGRGVTFMENNNKYHYKDPQGQEFIDAIRELTK
jgi:transketolase